MDTVTLNLTTLVNGASLSIILQAACKILHLHETGNPELDYEPNYVIDASSCRDGLRIGRYTTVAELYTLILNHQPATEQGRSTEITLYAIYDTKNQYIPWRSVKFLKASVHQEQSQGDEPTGFNNVENPNISTYIVIKSEERSDAIEIRMTFDSTVVAMNHIQRMAAQLECVLGQLCGSALARSTQIGDINTISDHEIHDIWTWNKTVPDAVDTCVHHLIANAVHKHPDAQAICAWDGDLTYAMLDKLSTKLAHHLLRAGIKENTIVPLCFEKSMWTPVAMLAVMKAGGASVTMDVTLPLERLRTIVAQVQSSVILASATNASLATRLRNTSEVVTVDHEHIMSLSGNWPSLPQVKPTSLLYVVFTSGSSGIPKGVKITHQNFAAAIVHQSDKLRYKESSRVFDYASYAFDAMWSSFLRTMCAGGCLCIPSETDRRGDISKALKTLRVNFASFPPAIARTLKIQDIQQLEQLILAGEKVDAQLASTLQHHCNVCIAYGPSECTVLATCADVNEEIMIDGLIGTGAGLNTWIIDPENGSLSPIGAVGELWLEGPLIGQGYLNDKEKTASAFVENPAWLLAGGGPRYPGRSGRLYRTGDLVRYSRGGLTFIARKDAQVKIRGQRVELGEVEHHVHRILAQYQEIQVVVEVVHISTDPKAILVCFVTLSDQRLSSVEKSQIVRQITKRLDDQLAERLPIYMIPSLYIPMERIPVTVNGKTDRQKLREIVSRMSMDEVRALAAPTTSPGRPPTGVIERQLQALWASILKIHPERISADDSFLRLGGDSIAAMRLVGAARLQGLSITVADVLRRPRLAELAAVAAPMSSMVTESISPYSLLKPEMRGRSTIHKIAALCDVRADQIEDIFPCTSLQEGLMSLSAKRSGDYTSRWVMKMQPSVDLKHFQCAWATTTAIIPILRSRIVHIDGQGLVQVIIREKPLWTNATDLKEAIATDELQIMGLGTALSRQALVNSRKDGAYFVWTAHHSLYDGWSMPLILDTLEHAYKGQAIPELVPFQTLVRHISQVDEELSLSFWKSQFASVESQQYPMLPSSSYQPQAEKVLSFNLTGIYWTLTNVTPTIMIRAAWAILMASYTASKDTIFGVTVTGRQAPIAGIERIPGPAITTVPLRVNVDHDLTVLQLLEQVQTQAIEMIPYEQIGIQRIRHISDEASQVCDFQTLLVVQPPKQAKMSSLLFSGKAKYGNKTDQDEGINAFNPYALMVVCQLEEGTLRVQMSFDLTIIAIKQVERIAAQLECILRQLSTLEYAQVQLCEIRTASDQDLHDVWTWNHTSPPIFDTCVLDLIAETMSRQSEAPAVCAWDGGLTYARLDDLSTRLAHYLVDIGVRPNSVIPLCFEKSVWMPVAMLAVMKAGGASAAIDGSLPTERLSAIIQQAVTKVQLPITEDQQSFVEVKPPIMNSDLSVVLCSASVSSLAEGLTGVTLVVIEQVFFEQLPVLTWSSLPQPRPSDRCCVVFTSGSTGVPKGTILTHSNLSNAIKIFAPAFNISDSSRIFDFVSYSFDFVWANLLLTLYGGGCLCIPSEKQRKDELEISIKSLNANFACFTPSVLKQLDQQTIRRLATIIVGGEPHIKSNAAAWSSASTILSVYGPSECTIVALAGNAHEMESMSIGRGLGMVPWIVSPEHESLSHIGAIGELYLEGPLVGAGYLNDSELTARSFLEDPPWLVSGTPDHLGRRGRLYRTGDLVKYNSDGSLTFVGRKDTQVKIRGQRVELEEVEHHVKRNLPTDLGAQIIAEVVPIRNSKNTILVVFIALTGSQAHGLSIDQQRQIIQKSLGLLVDRLAESLPTYMVPSAYIPIDTVPLTFTGKTDRRNLRNMAASMDLDQIMAATPTGPRQPPTSPTEHQLQILWAKVLEIDPSRISVNDSFIRLGGDSIRAMRLAGAAREQGISISVADILKQPCLADLARTIYTIDSSIIEVKPYSLIKTGNSIQETIEKAAAACGVHLDQIEDIFPCTPLQEGLMSLTLKHTGDNIARWVLPLQPSINTEQFIYAWGAVAAATPILRTRIINLSDQGLVQVVIQEKLVWATGDSTEAIIAQEDHQAAMTLGTPLSRQAIIKSKDGSEMYFVWTVHHAIYDGWSAPLVLEAIEDVYHGHPCKPLVPLQTLVNYIKNIDEHDGIEYWRSQFAGIDGQQFPRLAPSYQPRANKMRSFDLDSLPWTNIGFTSSTAIRAAWAILVAAYNGSNEAIVGATVTGRQVAVAGIEQMAGPSIATVPLRIETRRDLTITELLMQVQSQAIEMIPFEQMGLHYIRRMSDEAEQACQFQNLLVIQPIEQSHRESTIFGHSLRKDYPQNENMNAFNPYAIMVICEVEPAGLRVRVSFDSAVITTEAVGRIVAQLGCILRQICDLQYADTKIRDLNTLSDQDLHDIWTWNKTCPAPTDACIHNIISDVVYRQPRAQAIYAWDGELTFGQMDHLSTQLAHYIVGLGIGLGAIVPLYFEKSMWMPVAMLGVMKAGGASVAMDTTLPFERSRIIIEQVQPRLILSSTANADLVSQLGDMVIVAVDGDHVRSLPPPVSNTKLPMVSPTDLLYVTFTSGSTGVPKGVMITHQNMASSLHTQSESFEFTPHSRVLDLASYAFDAAWLNFIRIISAGGTLCIPSEQQCRGSPEQAICDFRPTFLTVTPTVAQLIDPSVCDSLQMVHFAGEKILPHLCETWVKFCRTVVAYGPSECTVMATCMEISEGSAVRDGLIGQGIGLNTWVVDSEHGSLCHIGAVGELWLEGPLVGAGYLNDSGKTAASFVASPAWLSGRRSEVLGRNSCLYRTGDLVRYNDDGSLTFVGRKDAQVKIRGQRLELGEVEYYIRRSLAVDEEVEVVAEVVTISSNKTILVCFIVLGSNKDRPMGQRAVQKVTEDLNEKLSGLLPAYMIPTAYVPIDQVPLTATGKTDRRKLHEMVSNWTLDQLAVINAPLGPRRQPISGIERQLQALWASVLRIDVDRISADDSFLRLGGDSVGAMKLVGAARDQGLSLSVADILRRPRLADLATIIHTESSITAIERPPPYSLLGSQTRVPILKSEVSALMAISSEQIDDVFPCTPLQKGLISLTAKRSRVNIARWVLQLQPTIKVEQFMRAWEATVSVMSILRTRIVDTDQGLVQVVIRETPVWISGDDLDSIIAREESHTVGLARTLSRQAIVTSRDGADTYFVWTAHHAIYDAWSVPLILEELEHQYYHGQSNQKSAPFQALVKHILSIDEENSVRFWKSQLIDVQSEHFPVLPSPSYQSHADQVRSFNLDGMGWSKTDYTATTIIRTAWAILAARYTGSEDAVFGVTVTGRQAPVIGIELIAGPAIATVPLRVNMSMDRDITVGQLLEQVQTQAIEMIPFEQIGIQRIRQISDSAEQACRFQTLLVVQPPAQPSKDSRLFSSPNINSTDQQDAMSMFNPYALMVVCQIEPGSIDIRISFDSTVLNNDQIEKIVGQLHFILRQLCIPDHHQTRLRDINTVSEQDLCDIWTRNHSVPPALDSSVLEVIADTFQRQPEALAVCAWDGRLTYAQLDSLSNHTAHHLIDLGVGPNVVVPLCFEKCMWMPVALMAVMKAGGASALMDSTQPLDRLRSIAGQVDSPLILCSVGNNVLAKQIAGGKLIVPIDLASIEHFSAPTRSLSPPHPSDHCCVVFTSGSTGIPKGAILSHSNLSSALMSFSALFGISSSSRVFDFVSYAFDFAWANHLITLYRGGCLCIPSEDQRQNRLAESIRLFQVNFAFFTPSLLNQLDSRCAEQLETIVLGGEPLIKSLIADWIEKVKIVSIYGPSECTVLALAGDARKMTDYSLGSSVMSNTWIVDPKSEALAHIGAVGELWLEGPLVGKGYINDTKMTAVAFVENPAWLLSGDGSGQQGRHGRLYRTGDLVRYKSDGTLAFVGRKDDQVKIRGQRVELGEVEHHVRRCLASEGNVQVVAEVVMVSKKSPDRKAMLLCFIALEEGQMMSDDDRSQVVQQMTKDLYDRLTENLPTYMIPSTYIPIGTIPLTVTGKTDRRRLRDMIADMNTLSMTRPAPADFVPPSTSMERHLRQIWSQVLNIPADSISVDSRFTRLGGDSITAMQVVSRCRARGILTTVASLLRAQTVQRQALNCVDTVEDESHEIMENVGVWWDLSPIQKMHFDAHPEGLNHYNQSFLLDIQQNISPENFGSAISFLMERHGMLRARFRRDENSQWKQMLVKESILHYSHHTIDNDEAMQSIVQSRQRTLDISNGPVFAADLFDFPNQQQTILLTAHHLVVDLVSWRIIWHDIAAALENKPPRDRIFPFQEWCMRQQDEAAQVKPEQIHQFMVSPLMVSPTPVDYWGLKSDQNTFAVLQTSHKRVDRDSTALLLGASNDAFGTEPIDILGTALLESFRRVFSDRPMPNIFLEGHGREPLIQGTEIDLSETVGWFTTIYPVPLADTHGMSLFDTLKRFKDRRKQMPCNGRAYFSGIQYNDVLKDAFDHNQIELLLNYAGLYQQLDSEVGLFRRSRKETEIQQMSPAARRTAVVDILIEVENSQLMIHFSWPRTISLQHQSRLHQWMDEAKGLLQSLPAILASSRPNATLSDFPLLCTSYDGLDNWIANTITELGLNRSDIQDVYPCSPTQEGIALSMILDSSLYMTTHIWRCVASQQPVDTAKLEEAWRATVRRHPILSTIIVSFPERGEFVQVVLERPNLSIVHQSADRHDAGDYAKQLDKRHYDESQPRHTLTICQNNAGEVTCRLDISHLLIDATSVSILVRDMVRAYGGKSWPRSPAFREVIAHLQNESSEESLAYWMQYLQGVQSCCFPVNQPLKSSAEVQTSLHGHFTISHELTSNIHEYCVSNRLTRSTFMQVAWALVLSQFTDLEEVCFGYLASYRDIPIKNVEETVGPMISMLIVRIDLDGPVAEILQRTQTHSIESLTQTHVSLAKIQHELELDKQRLFNTIMSVREMGGQHDQQEVIQFKQCGGDDPTEFDITVGVGLEHQVTEVSVTYSRSRIDDDVAEELKATFESSISYILNGSSENDSDLES